MVLNRFVRFLAQGHSLLTPREAFHPCHPCYPCELFFISHRFHRFLFAPLCHLSFIIYHLAQRNAAPHALYNASFLHFFVHFVFKSENIEKKPLKICKKCTKPIHLQLKYTIITCQNHKIYVNLAAAIHMNEIISFHLMKHHKTKKI